MTTTPASHTFCAVLQLIVTRRVTFTSCWNEIIICINVAFVPSGVTRGLSQGGQSLAEGAHWLGSH